MTVTAVLDILDLADTRLQSITVANGYFHEPGKIERAKLTPFNGYDLPAINYWSTGISSERNAYGSDNRGIPLFIEAHHKTMDDPFINIADKLAADIITALHRKPTAPKVSDDPDFDFTGVVSNIILEGYDYIIGQGQEPWCGVLVKLIVEYVTTSCDMYNFNPR